MAHIVFRAHQQLEMVIKDTLASSQGGRVELLTTLNVEDAKQVLNCEQLLQNEGAEVIATLCEEHFRIIFPRNILGS